MRCPFLRETQVKYCQAASIKKMIAHMASDTVHERCSSIDFVQCPFFKQQSKDHSDQKCCPYLQDSMMQYCGASSVTKYVPYSESSIIRCGNDAHRYCELYLSFASPENNEIDKEAVVDGIYLQTNLSYSANHMWLDQTEEGNCHIGVDAFLTQAIRHIDALNYVTVKGTAHPTLVLTVNGVDLQLIFPIPIEITGTNSYLRSNVQKIISHPYSSGWLFEGKIHEQNSIEQSTSHPTHLLKDKDAVKWMRQEVRHLDEFIHSQIIPRHTGEQQVMMNGGTVHPEFLAQLSKQEALNIFNEFFSPFARWRVNA